MAMSGSLQVRKEVSLLPELPLYWRAQRLPMGLDRGTALLLTGDAAQPAKTPKGEERVSVCPAVLKQRHGVTGHFPGRVPRRRQS